jgi:hypothetical protein
MNSNDKELNELRKQDLRASILSKKNMMVLGWLSLPIPVIVAWLQ